MQSFTSCSKSDDLLIDDLQKLLLTIFNTFPEIFISFVGIVNCNSRSSA